MLRGPHLLKIKKKLSLHIQLLHRLLFCCCRQPHSSPRRSILTVTLDYSMLLPLPLLAVQPPFLYLCLLNGLPTRLDPPHLVTIYPSLPQIVNQLVNLLLLLSISALNQARIRLKLILVNHTCLIIVAIAIPPLRLSSRRCIMDDIVGGS